ncbi:MAG: hypothetical protein JNK64_18275 [Myxococcales bacterium]|nr:hypothetical protein [Myxococcales bacterium]
MAGRVILASVAVAAITTATARPARAEDGETYRGTMAIVDVTSVAVLAAAAGGESAPGVGLGFAGYALGSPIVHAAHGRWGTAGAAFGLRVGLPAVAALIGCGAAKGGSGGVIGDAVGCLAGGALAAGAAVVAAVIIDYAVLAAVDDSPTPMMLSYGVAF